MSDTPSTSASLIANVLVSLPNAKIPVLQSDGTLTLPWRRAIEQLWKRTGGSTDLVASGQNTLAVAVAAASATAAQALTIAQDASTDVDDALLFGFLETGVADETDYSDVLLNWPYAPDPIDTPDWGATLLALLSVAQTMEPNPVDWSIGDLLGVSGLDSLGSAGITVTFGSGAPSGAPGGDGDFYFNTTTTPYAGYIGRAGAWVAFGGSVTSVGLSAPSIFAVAGSPVTTSGTLTITLTNQAANLIWAGPSSGAAAGPTFRALVGSDIPALPYDASGAAATAQSNAEAYAAALPYVSYGAAQSLTMPQQAQARANIGAGVGGGSVTSVGLSAPAEFSVSGSPVIGAGTLTFTKAIQSANLVWAGPSSGGAATPTFRALVAADIPSLSANYLVKSNNLSDVASSSTSRTNLGLGTIATQNANSVAITGGAISLLSSSSYQLGGSNLIGYGGGGSITNVAIGTMALGVNTTGVNNAAIGANSLSANTSGYFNIGIGEGSVTAVVSGTGNIGIGVNSLQATTGSQNIAIGTGAGATITSGNTNVAIGNGINIINATGGNQTNINNHLFAPIYAFASLPSASSCPGGRAMINDSTLALAAGLGLAAVGGGSNIVPIYSDGGTWRVG